MLILYSNTLSDYSQILRKAESISSSSEIIELWEDTIKEDVMSNDNTYNEKNKMVIIFPWKCPRTDAKKVTCIVALPSGVVPESVEFTFQGRNSFESQCFNLTFDWPEKLFSKRSTTITR